MKKKKRKLSEWWGVTYEFMAYYLGVSTGVYAMYESDAGRGLPLEASEHYITLVHALSEETPVEEFPVYEERQHAYDHQLPAVVEQECHTLRIKINRQQTILEGMRLKHKDALRRLHAADVLLSGKGLKLRPLSEVQKEWLTRRKALAEALLEENNPSTIALKEVKVETLRFQLAALEKLIQAPST